MVAAELGPEGRLSETGLPVGRESVQCYQSRRTYG